jgi:hypothetical protein
LRARYYNPSDGRFQSRDTWGGDANQPLSYNKWNYANSDPVNYTDPTGKFPIYCHAMTDRIQFEDCVRKAYGLSRPRQYDISFFNFAHDEPGCHYEVSPEYPVSYDAPGYLEGSGTVFLGAIDAKEEVYDFATMTSARFTVSGWGASDSLFGYALNTYFGLVDRKGNGNGFSSQRTIDDYSRGFINGSVGVSPPTDILPTLGMYRTGFMGLSLNPIIGTTVGTLFGQSGDPLPIIDLGASYTNSTMEGDIRNHTLIDPAGNKYVDVARLRQEIILGSRSPWHEPNNAGPLYYPLLPARLYAATMVDKWAKIYNELHNGW